MTQAVTIEGWLPEAVANGAHGHWAVKNKSLQEAQSMAYFSAKAAGWVYLEGRVHLELRFIFPNQRRRDMDNMISRAKGTIDGFKRFFRDDSIEWMRLTVDAEVQPGRKALFARVSQIQEKAA